MMFYSLGQNLLGVSSSSFAGTFVYNFALGLYHKILEIYSASYLVVPTFDILTCDDVLLPRAESTGGIKF